MKKKLNLLKDTIGHLFLKFVLPSVAGMIMVSLYILADTIFIGRGVGSTGLAALNISLPIYNILFATGLLFGVGGATAISVSLGKGEDNKVNSIFTYSIVTALLVGIIYTILGSAFLVPLARLLGAAEENIPLIKEYLGVIFMFAFAFVMVYALTPLVRNDKAPKLAMLGTIAGGLTNIVFDAIFIFVFNWGMRGAAIATVMSAFVTLGILLSHFFNGHSSLRLKKSKFNFNNLDRVIKNGVPSFIIEVSSGVVIFSFNIVILKIIGQVGVASYSIIANISLICVAIFTGIAQGLQPIISMNYGAELMGRVNKTRKLGVLSAIIFGAVFYVVGNLFPRQIISLFTTGDMKLINITVTGFHYYFISFILMGINIILGAYFQAIEAATYSTVISIARGIGFIMLGLLVLPRFLGVNGVWLTVPFAELATCILSLILILKRRT